MPVASDLEGDTGAPHHGPRLGGHAEGDLDFRGSLSVARDAPVGFRDIRLRFELDTEATEHQLATLLRLTDRYCVVYQMLASPPVMTMSLQPPSTAD